MSEDGSALVWLTPLFLRGGAGGFASSRQPAAGWILNRRASFCSRPVDAGKVSAGARRCATQNVAVASSDI